MQVLERSGLVQALGREVFFADKEGALQTLRARFESGAAAPDRGPPAPAHAAG
jgi:hypothetical protein